MATSNSDQAQKKRDLSPSVIAETTPKRTRIDTLFDTSPREEQISQLGIGEELLEPRSPIVERFSAFSEPGGGYDRSPTRDRSSVGHDLLGISEDEDEDEDDEEDDAFDQDFLLNGDHRSFRRSLYSELVNSSNLGPEQDEERRINSSKRMSSSLFDGENTDDLEDKTTLPLTRSQIRQPLAYEDEVDAFFSSYNPADEPEFVMSSSAKMCILQQQHKQGPLWLTKSPHFLTEEYFQQNGPQDRTIPTAQKPDTTPLASYFDSKFSILGKMGSGEFAEVWKCRCLDTEKVYAIKKSKEVFTGWDDRWLQLIEVEHLRRVKGSNYCVNIINAWEEGGYLYIELDLCSSGSLDKYIKYKNGKIPEDIVWKIFYETLLGVQDIHQADIAHLDLKPSNMLIDDQGFIKIGDFGISVQIPVDIRWVKGEGDRRYMAPDLLREDFNKPADIFSLGLILLELATGIVLPGTGESWEMLRLGDFSKQRTALSKLSVEMREMIEWLLTTESKDRPTVKDIISHPTVTNLFQQQQEQQTGSLQSYVYELRTIQVGQTRHHNTFSSQNEESLNLIV